MGPDQPADGVTAAGYAAGGVAGDDVAGVVEAHQSAGVVASAAGAVHGDSGVTGGNPGLRCEALAVLMSDKAANAALTSYGARGVGGEHGAFVSAHHGAGIVHAGDFHGDQPDIADYAVITQQGEQTRRNCARRVHLQVADGVPVAVENGSERAPRRGRDGREFADRRKAGAAGPGGANRTGGVTACGVKVQVGGQFVAAATAAGVVGVGEEGSIIVAFVAGLHVAVAVQVPANGVELLQGFNLDEAVAVGVQGGTLRLGRTGVEQGEGQGRHDERGRIA